MDNILQLHRALKNKTYEHGGYEAFNICDPKPRNIHKAGIRDRLVHHAIYRVLYPFFNQIFIADSYSCRIGKGTHKATKRFSDFNYTASKNNTKTCWVLKCDIRKFFASISHDVVIKILKQYIFDADVVWLLGKVIRSFSSGKAGIGLPLGNLTSQLFVNVYMNEFDQFVKHKLKAEHYIRYADDFVILSDNYSWLGNLLPKISEFLNNQLKLIIHPNKVSIRTFASGVDFLGWVNFPDHRILRTGTKKRMLKRITINPANDSLISYLGLLKHGNTFELRKKVFELTNL